MEKNTTEPKMFIIYLKRDKMPGAIISQKLYYLLFYFILSYKG